ncbi:hypothetical protein C0995_008231 [Termitomyces sp. Mi166|nr:hypothetical protein C0995_008231 [Termitomyces sp. Mi166\
MEVSSTTNPTGITDAPPASLPSTVEETLSRSPRFRILVVGNTGVGKSSLVANIFNVRPQEIDNIADGRAGSANIDREYTSDDYQCFALHDSNGFEPGSTEQWRIVKEFIRQRSKKSLPFEQRLHALWLCVETPRSGSRLLQTADEDLLKLAISRKIPVIVVFTKLDLLFNEFYSRAVRNQGEQGNRGIDPNKIAEDARISLRTSIEVFQQQFSLLKPKQFPWSHSKHSLNYVGVSTNHQFLGLGSCPLAFAQG